MKRLLLSFLVAIFCFSPVLLPAQETPPEAAASTPENYQSVVFASREDYLANKTSFENYFRIERDTPQASRYIAVPWKDSLMISQRNEVWGIRYEDTLYLHCVKPLKTFGYAQVLGKGRYRFMWIDMPPRAKIQEEIQISEEMRELYASHQVPAGWVNPGLMFGGRGGIGVGIGFTMPITKRKSPLIPVVMDMQDGSIRALTQNYLNTAMENYPALKPHYESSSAEQFTQNQWLSFLEQLNAAAAGMPLPEIKEMPATAAQPESTVMEEKATDPGASNE